MIRAGESVFVDSGAWIALALQRDPLHARAVDTWDALEAAGARLATSVPVVIETFTFLERNASREAALAWKDGLRDVRRMKTLECPNVALEASWAYFARRDLHRLSAVDATSFVLMTRAKIRVVFTFDHHFSSVGFRIVG
ncbi:MAG: PIN domain-containing protein [Deltaproteobacteria bacterium]|nr:PIN domain-containing protein [Deltaproteobacteria bacterium]